MVFFLFKVMADAEVSFRLTGDYSGAAAAIEETRQGLDGLGEHVEAANNALDASADKMQEAWALVGRELARTGNFAKAAAKSVERIEPKGETLSRWSQLGNVMSGVGSALSVAAGTAREVAGFISAQVLEPAMRLEKVKVQLAAVAGGGEQGRAAADFTEKRVRAFASRGGLEMEPLLEQVRLATAAGLEYKKSIELVERAWIAAAGREDFASNTIETFVEAMASAGESMAPFVDSLKKSGTDLKPILAEVTGWDLAQVQERLDTGRVHFEVLLEALRRATDEASPAARAFAEVAETAAAKLQAAKLAFEEALLPVAERLLPALTRALGDTAEALQVLDEAAAAEAAVSGSPQGLSRVGVPTAVAGVWSGVKEAAVRAQERMSGGDFLDLFPMVGIARALGDYQAGVERFTDELMEVRSRNAERYAPLAEDLRGQALNDAERKLLLPGAPVDAAPTAAAVSMQETADRVAAAVQDGFSLVLPDFATAAGALEDAVAAVNEVVPTVGQEDELKGSGEDKVSFYARDTRWQSVHSSLSAVGGGGYSATFRPLKEVSVQEKQLSTQKEIAEVVRRIEQKAQVVNAVLG